MPRGDKTGPEGFGPRTGRGLGYCTGYSSPGFMRGVPRGGAGFGFGRGFRGFGRGFWWRGFYPEAYYMLGQHPGGVYPGLSTEDEKAHLENVVKGMEDELKAVKERLQELSEGKKEAP